MPPKSKGGGAFITSADSVPDPRKAEQARRATEAGPPPGFAPAGDEPAAAPASSTPPAAPRVPPAGRAAGGGLPRPTLTPSVRDGGGFLFGMFLYVLGINYLRNGLPGVKGWFGAKFLNHQNHFTDLPGGPKAQPQHVTLGINEPYDIPYDGKQ